MNKITYYVLMLLFCMIASYGQTPSYSFASSNGTYAENTTAATLLPLVRADSYISPVQNIGFAFNYAGVNYTEFRMSSNGFISFNTAATFLNGNDFSAANTTSRPIIAPLWDDLDGAGSATSVAGYEITGTAPNRVLTIEWRNWEWNFAANNSVISFQLKLYETTNAIAFVYRPEATPVNNGTASIGIGSATGSGAGTFLNVIVKPFAVISNAVAETNISIKPAAGQTYTFTPSTCSAPAGLVFTNISQQTATLTWTADSPAPSGYEYVVQPITASTLGAATALVGNTANVVGLSQNTQYEVYLRKNCGSNFSSWVLAGRFTTLCNPQSEFVETFDTYPLTGTAFYADCWTKSNMTGTVNLTSSSAAPGSAPNRLIMVCSATTTAVAVLPPVSNLQANTHRLVFTSYATVASRTIDIGYLTNSSDIASFVVLQSLPLASTLAANATTQTVLPTGIPAGISSLAFRITGISTTAYLDDVKWELNSTCIAPIELIATEISSTSALVSWTEPVEPAANGYDFFRSTSAVSPLSTTTPTGSVAAGLNSTLLTGLLPGTVYYVWIRSKCSSTASSPYSNILTFLTNCSDVSTFSQNFDATTTLPACWKKLGVGGSGSISSTGSVSAPNSLLLNSTGTTVPTQGLVVMPPVSNAGAGTHRLVFRARSTSTVGGIIQVGYVTDNFDGSTFVSVQSFTTTSLTTFSTFSALLGTAPGANKFLAFRHAGSPANAVLIDNVMWEPIPTCFEPLAVSASLLTNTSATITWAEPATPAALGYEYVLSTTNTAPTAATTPTGAVTAGNATVNLTALTPQTNYFIFVRSVCTASDSSTWTSSTSFTTLCSPVTTFTQNFDAATTFPVCWSKVGTPGSASIQTSSAFSAPNCLYMFGSSATSQPVVAMPPVSNAGAGTHWLKFKLRANSSVGGILQVGYLTDLNDIASFVSVQSFTTNSTTIYQDVAANLGTAPGANQILAFRALGTPANSLLVDNVSWEVIPSCVEPTVLSASAITATTATISWAASITPPANGYEYFLSTTNATPSAASAATGATTAGTVSVNLTGLNPFTTYFIWVRSICSISDKSEWSSVATFSTLCSSATTFSQNFDAAVAFPTCWNKVGTPGSASIQTSSAFSTPNCLYMFGSSAMSQPVVAMPPVSNAGAGTHWLKFKLRANSTVGGIVQVGYLTNPTDITSFVSVLAFTANSTTIYEDIEANLGISPGANQVLAFRALGTPSNSLLIDNVSWEVLPNCVAPLGLVASAVTFTSATISWNAPATVPSNGYQYFLSTTNIAPTTATVATGSTAAGVTTVNLTSLMPSTNYFIWLRSICSASESSSWSGRLNFLTPCIVANVPYAENFESAVVPNMPNCSTIFNAGAGNNWTVAANPGSGFTSNTLQYQWNTANDANAWFFTNGINLTAGVQYKLNYRYGTSNLAGERMKIAYGTSATVAGMTTQLVDHSNIINTTPINAPQINFTPTTTGVYFFGFNAYSILDRWRLFVDDILIESVLSNNTFDNGNFSYYPNPVKDILTLDYSQNITNVAVYNLLGQQVIAKSVNANQSKIDMSNLNAGSYLVKVTADNQVKTIKIIKQ